MPDADDEDDYDDEETIGSDQTTVCCCWSKGEERNRVLARARLETLKCLGGIDSYLTLTG